MDEEKQIEEMAFDLHQALETENIPYYEIHYLAENLHTKGYRKASDVAREIITEFANMLKCHSFYMTDNYGEVNENVITVKVISEVEAELKKKYESEEM